MSLDCIFCRIINKEIPTDFVRQTDTIIVINDIHPKATIHYLIIPKKHIQDIQSFADDDVALAGNVVLIARDLSKTLPGASDFKLVVNSGKQAGQCVFHLHFHFLAGKQLGQV